jgi:cyclopropane fatty-acyl-phospholipid synthase-like methyltransferase
MDQPDVLQRMRSDWDRRALDDAYYYVAFGRKQQAEDEFFATGADTVRSLEAEVKRLDPAIAPDMRKALEIGCGPGRLMRPLARNFGEIHGVDVSEEMVRMAAAKLERLPNAHVQSSSGADLSMFSLESFDFVYSYAVFQHIPSREVIFQYLAEARRVLKNGGILRCQFNGLPDGDRECTTWDGVRMSARELSQFARVNDFQLLALEDPGTQYLWTTMRKQPDGWRKRLKGQGVVARIRGMANSQTGEPVVPASGRFAGCTIWLETLPADCDLNHLAVTFEGTPGMPTYLGSPVWDGVCQLDVLLPEGTRTGIVRVDVAWLGKPVAPPAWLRVIPPGPVAPRVGSVEDGINMLAGRRVESGAVKMVLEDIAATAAFDVSVDGLPAREIQWVPRNALAMSYELNFRLPEGMAAGVHQILLRNGTRTLPPVEIEVA